MNLKKIIAIATCVFFLGVAVVAVTLFAISSTLPQIISLDDYKPRLVSEVFDRNGQKMGEFFKESRRIVEYNKMPEHLSKAFIAAEDDAFFEHNGVVPMAFVRAFLANLKAGRKVQGGSTITMQVARSIILQDSRKTYIRKLKEVMLSYRMEENLSKEDIIFLYLNQIYLGQGAYGVGIASEIYFRKPVQDISLEEAALLAGLPQAPSRYSPIRNSQAAKNRQIYVLNRMVDVGFIDRERADKAIATPVKVYWRKNYKKDAPFYLETLRQMLAKDLGDKALLEEGLKIYTSLDLEKQKSAQIHTQRGLRELDKRQGFRGADSNLQNSEEITAFLLKTRDNLLDELHPYKIINPDGTVDAKPELNLTGKDESGKDLPALPKYVKKGDIVKAIVTAVNDKQGYASVRFAEAKGIISISSMYWARKPDPKISARWAGIGIKKPSEALKKGDIISVKVIGDSFLKSDLGKKLKGIKPRPKELNALGSYAEVELEQKPIAEAALISFDLETSEIISMVGGYNFTKSEFNRTIQAHRQTGSSFKALVYASALDRGYTPATLITDAPVVFEEKDKNPEASDTEEGTEAEEKITKWKPANHGHKFMGELLFRRSLIRSLNIPTVKIIEDIGVEWAADYARRLGIFSPLNMDYTIALGSSGVTPYEMTKAFAHLGRLGRRMSPLFIRKVVDQSGEELMADISLDQRFEKEITELNTAFEERMGSFAGAKNFEEDEKGKKTYKPAFKFEDPEQLIKPTTAYMTTQILEAAIYERGGTGGGARSLGRPAAGKTGTTNGYYDAWFVGYTPDIATGVWVGFDEERSLGKSETGGRAALPIWLGFMKDAHKDLPKRQFQVPEGIIQANIDNETGRLASPSSSFVVTQAFEEGTEPQNTNDEVSSENGDDDSDFYKQELTE